MNQPAFHRLKLFGIAARLVALAGLALSLAATNSGFCEDSSFTEYQVKALFLLNFTKYVGWPDTAFAQTNAPITIGVYGEDPFDGALEKTVAGRKVNGRGIVIEQVHEIAEMAKCQVLFISSSARTKQGEILGQLKSAPVLTVGESDKFTDEGGVINFIRKADKIRLEINVEAAQQAKLQISSKLLSVADVVKGRPK